MMRNGGLAVLVLGFPLAACRPGDSAPAAAPPAPAISAATTASSPNDRVPDPESLAVPGPAAAPCTSDAMCLNHRCNLAYGKCAFPCASDRDCVRGAVCFKAVISTCQSKAPSE